jgi:DNA topoisomerase-6 subunit B
MGPRAPDPVGCVHFHPGSEKGIYPDLKGRATMPTQQTQLGDGQGIAEELAASQRSISIAEFFEKNKHMLGFDSGARAVVTAVKEAVDNALDACEEAGIPPDLYVEIQEAGDYYRLVVEDNGPGITEEQIPKIFGKLLYGSRFHKREQNRGQQGIGISAAVLYAQLTSGKPAKITSRTQGSDEAQYFELIVDTDENEPEVDHAGTTSWDRPHGTRIEFELEGNMRARQQLHDYVKHTAVVNPHARIELVEPTESFKFERATDRLPAETEEIRPHPHGVELGTLIKMLEATDSYSVSGFLQNEFTRVGSKTADGVIDAFRDRHFGREMTWQPPKAHEDADVEAALTAAVSNKGKAATADFASQVADRVGDFDRLSHHQLADVIDDTASIVEDDHEVTFGSTVRENAREAAWRQVLGGDSDEAVRDSLGADLYAIVDGVTTDRKDDAAIEGLSDRLAAKFVGSDDARHRSTRDEIAEFVRRAADATEEYDDATFGDTARENVVEAIWERMLTVPDDPPKVSSIADDRDAASDLLAGMRATDIIAPPTDCLAPITAELVEEGLRKEFDADFYAAETRDASVHGGDPFIVEAGIAYGGDIDGESAAEVLRFANRVPLVYQRGACATTDVVKNINWRNYGLDQSGGTGIPTDAAVVMVHVASTNVPFTSESKDAVANVPEIESEIELAVREAARDLKSYLNKRRSMQQRRKKQNKLATVLPEMAEKLAEVTEREPLDIDDTMARIMNNVLVEREREGDTVRLIVENNSTTNASLEITDIASAEPESANGARIVAMDDEWFVKWHPTIESGDEAVLEYDLDDAAEVDVDVAGVEDAKLTVNA